MSKLDNHIYLIICEITYEQFKSSKSINYINHCNIIKSALISQDLGKNQARQISSLLTILTKTLGIDVQSAGVYIANFYRNDKFIKFGDVVATAPKIGPEFRWLDILR